MLEPSTLIYRALTDDDLEHVLADLRKSDEEVLRLFNVRDIREYFRDTLAAAREGLTIDADGTPIGLAGLHLMTSPGYDFAVGCFWVAGTEALTAHLGTIAEDLTGRWAGLCKALTVCYHIADTETRGALDRLGFVPCPTPVEFGEAARSLVQMVRES